VPIIILVYQTIQDLFKQPREHLIHMALGWVLLDLFVEHKIFINNLKELLLSIINWKIVFYSQVDLMQTPGSLKLFLALKMRSLVIL